MRKVGGEVNGLGREASRGKGRGSGAMREDAEEDRGRNRRVRG